MFSPRERWEILWKIVLGAIMCWVTFHKSRDCLETSNDSKPFLTHISFTHIIFFKFLFLSMTTVFSWVTYCPNALSHLPANLRFSLLRTCPTFALSSTAIYSLATEIFYSLPSIMMVCCGLRVMRICRSEMLSSPVIPETFFGSCHRALDSSSWLRGK